MGTKHAIMGTNIARLIYICPKTRYNSTSPFDSQVFNEAIASAVHYKANSDDFVDQVLELLHEDGFGGES